VASLGHGRKEDSHLTNKPMGKGKFIHRESFKHLFAKNLLKKWFLESEKDGSCEVAQFQWRGNYGVFAELKFYETSDPCYFEVSGGLDPDKDEFPVRGNPKDLFLPNFNRGKILFVPDVTIFHKGSPKYLLEVVHTNPLSKSKIEKIDKFFGGCVNLFEIEAEEILKQDSDTVPEYLECRQILKW